MGWSDWPAYVPVAERRKRAQKKLKALQKQKGVETVHPVIIEGRQLVTTFWGQAWCDNLKSYSDFANRLKRGSSYVCNGLVIDLAIQAGKIEALVYGTELYQVAITIEAVKPKRWEVLIKSCQGQIGSLIELIQGKLSKHVMALITHPDSGLFPHPREIRFTCSCFDFASMCKHIAATLYGVGARLDTEPETLFVLRHVRQEDLVAAIDASATRLESAPTETSLEDLSNLFGIALAETRTVVTHETKKPPRQHKKPAR